MLIYIISFLTLIILELVTFVSCKLGLKTPTSFI
jgi:hypothetical protein